MLAGFLKSLKIAYTALEFFIEKVIFVCISCQQIIRMFLRAATNAFLMAILHLFLKECNIKTRFYSSPSDSHACLDLYLIKIFPDLKLGSGSPIFQIIGFIHNISSPPLPPTLLDIQIWLSNNLHPCLLFSHLHKTFTMKIF